ncbi:DUF4111 domain-containing protein [Pradoshia sp. D12]|uniref:aminoglycoside adenylyltransferase domain-containing protein n=1 Tax=Bacillaceae TaxID=186817 RepID=UPI0011274DAF|nr:MULTISPECIES: aminoglycoside adenylyltransferase domain-containing protein [Bacillaceae]QFK70544.1 DUF4111 domain-containing protein [Pradoshia sp. D12]TPF72340.1 DUF4111 domain-containing protein [Bacillus sp. D12]
MLKIPKIVETILNEYEGLFNEYLPNELEGLYLHGSIALDAFEKGKSDIDFISVTSRHFTEDEAGILSKIHRMIAQKYKTPEMDGVYITWGDLGKVNNNHQNHFYYNSGNLSFGPYFNFNPVTWTLFAKKGITVLGPASSDFELEFRSKQLQSYVFANMNTYWGDRVQWLESSFDELLNMPAHDIREEIEWTVLGLLCQYYTLAEDDIISKTGAGRYGLSHMPKEYHQIINEAVLARTTDKETLYSSNKERLDSTLTFSKYLIKYCQRFHFI